MADNKAKMMWLFMTIVVFLVLGAVNGLLAYSFNNQGKALQANFGADFTVPIHSVEIEVKTLQDEYAKYKAEADKKAIAIAELTHQLSLAVSLSKTMLSRAEYRTSLVRSIRDMTSNLASARDELVKYYDDKREDESNYHRTSLEDYSNKSSALDQKKANLENQIASLEKRFIEEMSKLNTMVDQIRQDIENLQAGISYVEKEESIDGAIIMVNNFYKYVIINIGMKEGIKPGQRFKVFQYDSNRVPKEKGFVICRTLSDHVSYAQIVTAVDDANPVLEGDFISSPLYSPDEPVKICIIGELKGYMSIDEESRIEFAKKLKRNIEEYGAIYSEEVTPDCTYVVVSKAVLEMADDGAPTPEMKRLRRAKELEIPVLDENEFLRFITN